MSFILRKLQFNELSWLLIYIYLEFWHNPYRKIA